ncbi:MAG: hypothetical protein UR69_C0002G0225 [Candidatus Moranbacteria bacterium GW2011_GWE2_35_2-]|nr:MAG: hypothetical protein UR69_C0002G0225 [Candidatus Moranbacteria bacterium GW2011_GWE2_35_2-]KKQ06708.1 MAG: hypothetical protein US15_C0005G0009 [Candidatus Moranbacteria bacterium GW2011_GWF1_36_4]KKQ22427.1 MAG: hypothetical protein US37_C0002G0052 [Candidatus Moranbacteria bacterium GW2011_GWF2_37_11]KKQ29496.1 MAG: hypothetical protein US44_C0001G0088 [Candidatus Moranbacteria bacterium GW2011_GWD1_37_17]KKQ30635.1 MAG: hypothetical protein US47_C0002G0225 [Candidatus Moranbacteria b
MKNYLLIWKKTESKKTKANKFFKKFQKFDQEKLRFFLVLLVVVLLDVMVIFVYFFKTETDREIVVKTFNFPNNSKLRGELVEMTKGYPIEKMIPLISRQDEEIAAFLISIAKKESNWGKRVPRLNGEDCYNYWGYRGIREKMGTGGHTCFDSPQDAVRTVSARIKKLIEQDVNTPSKMVVWKCGYSCNGHSDYSVKKWINDVDYYFGKINGS